MEDPSLHGRLAGLVPDAVLEACEAAVRDLWPSGEVPLDALAAHLRPRLQRAVRHPGDAVLVAACLANLAPALDVLDRLLVAESRRVAAQLKGDAAELASLVRARLLTSEDGAPRLASYDGAGPLAAWVRTVAARLALNARRAAHPEEPLSNAPDAAAPLADPELALLRLQYRAHFRAAFEQAVAALAPRERTVLRLHTLDGLSLASIGAMYRRDGSTVSRWLEQIRASLLTSTRAALTAALQLSGGELDSLMRAADGELSVSLAALLESAEVPE